MNPAWSVETGITIEWKGSVWPSYSVVTTTPSKLILYISCYDAFTGELLDCAFTYNVPGLKPPPELLDNNGGHNHNFDTRPLIEPRDGKLDVVGGEFVYLSNLQINGQTRKTEVSVTHPMPQAAGKIQVETIITAPRHYECVYKCWTETSNRYLGTMDVGIERLAQLPDSGDYHTVCRSEVCPPFSPLPGASHPYGTYGTSETIETLQEIAQEYFVLTGGRKLSVNDLSLPKGGLFDYKATWSPPHDTHRTGTDADINRAGVNCNVDTKLRKAVGKVAKRRPGVRLVCENTAGRPDPNGPFKHIDFD